MKLVKIFIFLVLLLNTHIVKSQSSGCSFAPSIPVTSNCSSPIASSSVGGTESFPGCSGNADDDVWYEFTATASSHEITIFASTGYDPVLQVFSNTCSSLTTLGCIDNFGTGIDETFTYQNFTPGQTYKMRIYHYGAGYGSGDFDICITNPPAPPVNDECAGAVSLNVNSTCVSQTFSSQGATQSLSGCSGNADDDVWFSFVATNSVQDIIVDPISSLDLVVHLYQGNCSALTSLNCMDNTFTGDQEVINAVGLTPGETYYFRVYDYYTGSTGDFEVCVVGTPTPAPTNDEPCDAILLPPVTSACNYASFNNVGATTTSGAGIPTPSSCAGGSGAAIGGFTSGTADVWFQIVVPSTGNINITAEPNLGTGAISDGVMALYSGDCNNMTQIACADDYGDYPGSSHDLLPMITESGLTPGDTLYLRYWGFGTSQGDFGFCVNTALNDDCVDALYICDINGYSGSTSAAYTPTRPSNMRGNAEQNDPPDYTYTPGTNTGGVFGQGGPWGTGAPNYDVQIDNNSWISFTASDVTAVLNVSVIDCWIGNYPSGGIQMQIFDADNCSNFVPVSNFEENSTGFTITANNLTIGNDYYLMVDGYAGDICSYTISANSGIQFPDIPDVAPICLGDSVVLTAPAGADSYLWDHSGETTQSVTVSPSTTTTYSAEVTGLCDYKQTLDVEVEVIQLPTVTIDDGGVSEICIGSSTTLIANGASSYEWQHNGATSNQVSVSPGSVTTYEVIGTSNGCSDTADITLTVNPLPELSVNPTAVDADCGLSNGSLTGGNATGNGPLSYEWTDNNGNVVGTSLNLNNIPAGLYTLEIFDANGCNDDFGPFSVANPGAPDAPSITVDANEVCDGTTVSFSVSSTDPSADFSWSGPNGFTSTSSSFTIEMDATTAGNYCVNATVSNCTSPASCETILVNELPELALSSNLNNGFICEGEDVSLTVEGASSYSWTGPNNYAAVGSSINLNQVTENDAGWYVVTGSNSFGCLSQDSIAVSVNPAPDVMALADEETDNHYCEGDFAYLYGSGGESYAWSGPSGYSSSQQNPVLSNFNEQQSGMYILTVIDENGCTAQDSVIIELAAVEEPLIAADDTVLCPGDDIYLWASGASNYNWSGPNGFTGTGSEILIENVSAVNSGYYYVEVDETYNCSDGDSIMVLVQTSNECFFVPGLVTPNGDNLNDTWLVTGIEGYPDAEVSIYNRWGNLVFFAAPYKNNWSGQVNKGVNMGDGSGLLPTGTYFYVIELNDGESEPVKGYIELQY